MGVEGGPGDQGDEVAPVLGVDEEDALPRFEDVRHGSGFRGEGRVVGVAYRDEDLLARGDPEGMHELVLGPQGAAEYVEGPRDDQPGPVAGEAASHCGAQEAP
jgi:hypothetical protein